MMSRVLKTATALLAFMLMASVAVWAAPAVTAPTVSVDGATGNVTVSTQINDGGTPLPGKQVTMLTYLGTPTDTSIIGIDQDASDTNGNKSFTFGTDAATPNGTYTVLVGGEDVNTAASATMDFTKSIEINPVPSPVPVSQPVTLTAVAKLNGTENVSYNSAITWSADGGTITPDTANPAQATFTAAAAGTYTVTATLGDVSNTTSVVVGEGQPGGIYKISGTIAYGSSAPLNVTASKGTVAVTGNSYTVSGLNSGDVVTLTITANGHITYTKDITVSNADITKDVSLIAGDADKDGSVGPTDLQMVFDNWFLNADGTNITADIDYDGSIGPTDLQMIFDNWFKSSSDYGN